MSQKPSIDDLLAAVKEGTARKRRKIETHTNTLRYIEEMGLEPGTQAVPNFVLYWHYRQIWQGSDRHHKANKIVFFRTFSKKFPSHRVGKQRFYLLKDNCIELNEHVLEEAKTYDKKYVRLGKKKKQLKKKTEKFLATAPGTKLHRVEFIETQNYINGVRNERGGELVIPPLNDYERDWLAKFNSTYEHGNFDDDFMELTQEERSAVNHQDYARKSDLYFVAKSSGNLIQYDLMEYDKLTSEAEKDISAEDLKLNHLEQRPVKTRRPRGKRTEV